MRTTRDSIEFGSVIGVCAGGREAGPCVRLRQAWVPVGDGPGPGPNTLAARPELEAGREATLARPGHETRKASNHRARAAAPWLPWEFSSEGQGRAGPGFQVRRRLQVATPQAGGRSRQSFNYEAGPADSQGTWFRTQL